MITVGNRFDISRIMARNATAITISRGDNTTLTAQDAICVPPSKTQVERATQAGIIQKFDLVVVGYRDVEGKTNIDIIAGDRFKLNATPYGVLYVDDSIPGRKEAYCTSYQGNKRA